MTHEGHSPTKWERTRSLGPMQTGQTRQGLAQPDPPEADTAKEQLSGAQVDLVD